MFVNGDISGISHAGWYEHTSEYTSAVIHPHFHHQIELLFFEEGCYAVTVGDAEFLCRPGEVLMINSNEHHYGEQRLDPGEKGSYYYLQLSLRQSPRGLNPELDRLLNGLEAQSILLRRHLSKEEAKECGIFRLGVALAETCRQKNVDFFKQLVQTLQMYQLIHEKELYSVPDLAVQSPDPFVQAVAAYINDHCAEELRLEQLARHWGYDKHYFCNLFKKHFNSSFTHYLAKVRVTKFLTHPRLGLQNIATCAAEVGFPNYPYFHRCFSRIHHCSPREYLTKMRR